MNKKITALILSSIMFLQVGITPEIYAVGNSTINQSNKNIPSTFIDKIKNHGPEITAGIAVGAVTIGAITLALLNKSNSIPFTSEEDLPHIAKEYSNYLNSDNKSDEYNGEKLSLDELKQFRDKLVKILKKEPNVPEIEGPAIVVGDIHGNFEATNAIIKKFEDERLKNSNLSIVFLGDYIDRGPNNVDTLALLFNLKLKYPKNVHLICGNHEYIECGSSRENSLLKECKDKYPKWEQGKENRLKCVTRKQIFQQIFDNLPKAVIINEKIFCTHGGVPFENPNLDNPDCKPALLETIKNTSRGTHYGENSINEQLVNNRLPTYKRLDCEETKEISSAYGLGYWIYTPKAVNNFLTNNTLNIFIHGHDHEIAAKNNGAHIIKIESGEIITLLSDPDFIKKHYGSNPGSFNHNGAFISIDNENNFTIYDIDSNNDITMRLSE